MLLLKEPRINILLGLKDGHLVAMVYERSGDFALRCTLISR
jgi:hypothetical protein